MSPANASAWSAEIPCASSVVRDGPSRAVTTNAGSAWTASGSATTCGARAKRRLAVRYSFPIDHGHFVEHFTTQGRPLNRPV